MSSLLEYYRKNTDENGETYMLKDDECGKKILEILRGIDK